MRTLMQDFRYGLRMVRRQPTFSLVVVMTLALAIGANTVIFSFANILMLRPLPLKDQDSLAWIFGIDPHRGGSDGRLKSFAGWSSMTIASDTSLRSGRASLLRRPNRPSERTARATQLVPQRRHRTRRPASRALSATSAKVPQVGQEIAMKTWDHFPEARKA